MKFDDMSPTKQAALSAIIKENIDPAPTPIIHGTKGFLYVYGPGMFSVTINGDCPLRNKGRRYKGIKVFAMGDDEVIIHAPFTLYAVLLKYIGAEEYIEIIEKSLYELMTQVTVDIE